MSREDIIRMAREAQLINEQGDCMYGDATEQMLAFAALIAEDCAKRCDDVASLHEEHREHARAYGADTAAIAIREAYKT